MNINNDIEFKKWVISKANDEHFKIEDDKVILADIIDVTLAEFSLSFEVLMNVVEKINTSSGNVKGHQYYIQMGRTCFTIVDLIPFMGEMVINNDFVNKSFNWSEHSGMIGALKEAIYYIYKEGMK